MAMNRGASGQEKPAETPVVNGYRMIRDVPIKPKEAESP